MSPDLWEPIRRRVEAEARTMGFGEVVVTVRVEVRNGQLFRMRPSYEAHQAYGPADLKQMALDKDELA